MIELRKMNSILRYEKPRKTYLRFMQFEKVNKEAKNITKKFRSISL